MADSSKTYDLIFSIGEACLCSEALRDSHLQLSSYPMDWLFGSTFKGRCEIVVNRFAHFMDKEDLEYAYSERSIKCEAYHNKRTDLTHNHDFFCQIPFDKMYPLVAEKYARRITRLLEQLESAAKILIVYVESPASGHRVTSDEEIKEGFALITNAFGRPGKTMDLIYVAQTEQKPIRRQISEHILKIACDYKDWQSPRDGSYRMEALREIFSSYSFRGYNWKYRARRKILKVLISLLPWKVRRVQLRERFHI